LLRPSVLNTSSKTSPKMTTSSGGNTWPFEQAFDRHFLPHSLNALMLNCGEALLCSLLYRSLPLLPPTAEMVLFGPMKNNAWLKRVQLRNHSRRPRSKNDSAAKRAGLSLAQSTAWSLFVTEKREADLGACLVDSCSTPPERGALRPATRAQPLYRDVGLSRRGA
jgi:hypothetical protein